MSGNLHIIHRVNLEIEAPDLQTANQVQEKALLLLKNEILPRLERYLDSLDTGEKHVQLNQLNLDLKSIVGENFEGEFANDAVSVFREQMEARIKTTTGNNKRNFLFITLLLRHARRKLFFHFTCFL